MQFHITENAHVCNQLRAVFTRNCRCHYRTLDVYWPLLGRRQLADWPTGITRFDQMLIQSSLLGDGLEVRGYAYASNLTRDRVLLAISS